MFFFENLKISYAREKYLKIFRRFAAILTKSNEYIAFTLNSPPQAEIFGDF